MLEELLSIVIGTLLTAPGGDAADQPSASTGQPATQPARHLIVEGQVFDYIGSGVSGVDVRVFIAGDDTRKEIASTTTDEMGDFKVHHTEPVQGKLVVTIAKRGFKAYEVAVEAEPGEFPPFIDHQLQGDFALRGSVRDHLKDKPIDGAKVVLRVAYSEWSATADESGKFTIDGLSPCRGTLTVEAEGFARLSRGIALALKGRTDVAHFNTTTAPAEDNGAKVTSGPTMTVQGVDTTTNGLVLLVLKPERIVHLTVTDENGAPIPKVVVESLVKDSHDFRSGATDSSGQLALRGLSIDDTQLELRLTHPQYVSSVSFERTIELPSERAESSHTLTMASAATITGTVRAANGRALGGARLAVGPSVRGTVATEWSEFDGTFTLAGVPAGEAVVTVHVAEHAPRLLVVQADPNTPTTLEVVLSPAVRLAGRVLDPDGKPVPHTHVIASEWQGYRTLALQAMTDADGRFTILDAPADEFTVSVSAPGFEWLVDQLVKGGDTDLIFQFTEVRAKPVSPLAARLKPGTNAPAFEATTLDGRKIKLADFKGKYLFLDIWATWCGPCVIEMPHVVALHKALGPRIDFEIIGVSLDFDEKALRRFMKGNQLDWPQVFGEEAGATRMADQFGAAAIPATYLIGPDGKIIAVDLGGKQLTESVRKLIEKPKPPSGE